MRGALQPEPAGPQVQQRVAVLLLRPCVVVVGVLARSVIGNDARRRHARELARPAHRRVQRADLVHEPGVLRLGGAVDPAVGELPDLIGRELDRKSTRLNSSHMSISYAVFCLKKKKKKTFQHSCTKKKITI